MKIVVFFSAAIGTPQPAQGQLTFVFMVEWLPLPPRPPPPKPPPALPSRWWRRRREARKTLPERPTDQDARTIDRWLRRGAACVLCGSWPAPCDHRLGARLLLVCRRCEQKPDTLARLNETVRIDWTVNRREESPRKSRDWA